MSDPVENKDVQQAASPLASAIRDVKNAFADRDDVVVDIREAQLTRLEMLADELKPVFADIPRDDERFDLAISAGSQPRLWIDAVAHVTMGRDRRTYRFLHDTLLGRTVLAESADMKQVAGQVTRYIASRMVERQRLLDGDGEAVRSFRQEPDVEPAKEAPRRRTLAGAIGMVLLGGLVGAVLVLALAWFVGGGGLR